MAVWRLQVNTGGANVADYCLQNHVAALWAGKVLAMERLRNERQSVRFDELFEMRKLTGIKLKDYISGNGFSKVSFCKKTEISRPTLDKILNGEIDRKSSFDKHLNKIFTSLGIGPDTLMEFSTKTQSVDAMYSQKALINYQMNDKAKMEYDLLQDILNLCSVYYQRQKAMSEQTTAANLDEVIETQMKQSESA